MCCIGPVLDVYDFEEILSNRISLHPAISAERQAITNVCTIPLQMNLLGTLLRNPHTTHTILLKGEILPLFKKMLTYFNETCSSGIIIVHGE